jgi:Uma2 family endonuclease
MNTAQKIATYEDVLAASPGVVAELIWGALHTQPRPALKHVWSSGALFGELRSPFQGGPGGVGGWIILIEPEVHLARHVLVPDLAGWRRERLPKIEDKPFIELAPDWICEVLSPSTVQTDRKLKMPIYAQAGVTHLWLMDPIAQTLEAYVLENTRWVLLATYAGDESARIPPFDAMELSLRTLWAE